MRLVHRTHRSLLDLMPLTLPQPGVRHVCSPGRAWRPVLLSSPYLLIVWSSLVWSLVLLT